MNLKGGNEIFVILAAVKSQQRN